MFTKRLPGSARKFLTQMGVAACLLSGAVHAQTYSRTEAITYRNDLTNWVLGQVETQSSNGVLPSAPSQMVESQRTDYNAQGLPWKVYRFGKLQQTLTYKGLVRGTCKNAPRFLKNPVLTRSCTG